MAPPLSSPPHVLSSLVMSVLLPHVYPRSSSLPSSLSCWLSSSLTWVSAVVSLWSLHSQLPWVHRLEGNCATEDLRLLPRISPLASKGPCVTGPCNMSRTILDKLVHETVQAAPCPWDAWCCQQSKKTASLTDGGSICASAFQSRYDPGRSWSTDFLDSTPGLHTVHSGSDDTFQALPDFPSM